MKNEFEIVQHQLLEYLNLFLVQLKYRNPHMHGDFEMDLVLSGNAFLISHNRTENLHMGDIAILNPNEVHEIKTEDDVVVILCAQLSPRYLRDAFLGMGRLSFNETNLKKTLNSHMMQNLRNLFIELAYQYQYQQVGWQLLCRSLVDSLVYFLMKNVPIHTLSEVERDSIQRRIGRLNRIISYVEENYSCRLLLSKVAEQEGLTLSYLSHFIKDNLNQTFQEYVTTVRFRRAKTLLLSDKKLIDVCLESGFSDPRYLTKAFLRYEGCTPAQYKLKHNDSEQMNTVGNIEAFEQFLPLEASMKILRPLRKPLGSFFNDMFCI